MNILLVYPKFADALWAYKHALQFVGKSASSPPLGLLTVAAMLPEPWTKKLVDMNITDLADEDILWADYVFLSAMLAQQTSAHEVITRCEKIGTRIIAGGPLFAEWERGHLKDIDHVVIGEAEAALPILIRDLQHGTAEKIYQSPAFPDIRSTPIPLWSLVDMDYYSLMAIQFTRGCPFDCEFCNVVAINGHRPRVKDKTQILSELDALYSHGWRGHVFVCDDNLLGNSHKIRAKILPIIIDWMQAHDYPFNLTAAVSVDLADDEEILDLMVKAGFDRVTIGVESVNEESLKECNKLQNRGRDLLAAVRKIQNRGLEVQGGFIVGFDHDPTSVFDDQIHFIQDSGIVTAMVSILFAFPGTKLYKRLEQEKRLLPIQVDENAYGALDYLPKMNRETLVNGHKHILQVVYSPRQYYERINTFLDAYIPNSSTDGKLEIDHLRIFLKASWILGVSDSGRSHYWRLLAHTLRNHPKSFSVSVRLAITGYFFRKDIEEYLSTPVVA